MHPNAIEVRHLRYFLAVARAESFKRAAEAVHVAQPAVSYHIGRLECALGGKLFKRTPRGAVLTPFGEHIADHARTVIAAMDALRGEALTAATAPVTVRLGLPMTLGPAIGMDLLRQVRADLPRIDLVISDGMSTHLVEGLKEGRLDAAILFENQADPHLATDLMLREPLHLVGAYSAFEPGAEVALRDIGAYPLVLPTQNQALHQLVKDAAAAHGLDLAIRYEIDLVSEIIPLVESGEAYAPLAPIAFSGAVASRRVTAARIVEPGIDRGFVWATLRGGAADALAPVRAIAQAALDRRTRASAAIVAPQ